MSEANVTPLGYPHCDAAKRLGVSRATYYRHCRKKLKTYEINGREYVSEDELKRFQKALEEDAGTHAASG